ncbi:formate/nitrite transporter family protein [Mycetocola sp.]|uniref:formate/nitrite transporter family protein n=1 Tax=Mycetocola sp. TaxID=1871042 RepID=UPI0039895699
MSSVKPDSLIDSLVDAGVVKANLSIGQMLARGTLAGAILACATMVAFTANIQTQLPLVGAVIFPVGFVIIVLLGLELVTGSFKEPFARSERRLSGSAARNRPSDGAKASEPCV